MESNPNHPVTRALGDHWHKIAALIMLKNGERHVVLTSDDIAKLGRPQGINIVAQEKADGLHIRIVGDAEAARLAREHGGRAVDS